MDHVLFLGRRASLPRQIKESMHKLKTLPVFVALAIVSIATAFAQDSKLPANDIPPEFKAPVQPSDFDKRVVMVPMRDGTKLYTVIVVPKGAKDAPASPTSEGGAGCAFRV